MTLLDRIVADKNRDEQQWLEARRQGVTATDIVALEKGGAAARAALLKDKRDASRQFHGNAYTAWGLEREPVIAEWISEKFGHQPSDVTFHAAENRRHLATPDGLHIKDGIITIAEIKTSKHDLEPGSDAFISSHYMAQCQWQMYVCDVNECLFVWEVREGEPGDFKPGKLGHAWIERDEGHIRELIELADSFLHALDYDVDDDPADYTELVERWVEEKEAVKRHQEAMADLEQQLLDRIGDRDSFHIETTAGKVTLTTPKPAERFDSTKFKTVHPEMWRKFIKLSQAKPSLRITPAKGAGDDVF